ncbi:MAG: hypothetical protein IJI23_00225 [Lachnospiraceae bacterium]|nr:hypothetical protein [Lachnospiraceae bacterium]
MRPSQKVEVFPDGIVDIYEEDDGRRLGRKKGALRFEKQTVGVTRYYQAQVSVSSNRIDRVIKVPHNNIADRMDIAVVRTEDNRQYRILRIQEKTERGVDFWELESVQVTLKAGGGT